MSQQEFNKAMAQPFMMMVPMGMPVTPSQQDQTPEKKDSTGKKKDYELEGFESAAKKLTMSSYLIEKLPPNVREWTPDNVEDWLKDVFSGAADMMTYVKEFRRIGVKGVDILTTNEERLRHLGINDPVHLSRAMSTIAQLINYQNEKDKETEIIEKRMKEEKAYFDLEKTYGDLTANGQSYELPAAIELWRPIDVFAFVKSGFFQARVVEWEKFIVPLAVKKVNGKDLLDISKSTLESIQGLTASKEEVLKFKKAVTEYKNYLEEKAQRVRVQRSNQLFGGLPPCEKKQIKWGKFIDSGSYGFVYKGEYNKRLVAIKVLRAGMKAKTAQNIPQEVARKPVVSKSESGDTEVDETDKELEKAVMSLKYEAAMLKAAAGPGVVKLVAIDLSTNNGGPPVMLIEFMRKGSLFRELSLAVADDSESIFHPDYHSNRLEAGKGLANPVLLQRVRIARDVAVSLARLHSKNIIHLDIAARNIFLDAFKRPMIGDFGCATFEEDMIKQYKMHQKLVADYGHQSRDEFQVDVSMNLEYMSCFDENAILKYNTQMAARPVKWMPDWVVGNCGTPPNPRIDRHADVYSFGCLMYEIATHRPPHYEIAELADVIHLKSCGRGNPSIPSDVDSRFAAIMGACWNSYDDQPTMDDVAKQLTALHKQIYTEYIPGSGTVSYDIYSELKSRAAVNTYTSSPNSIYSGSSAYGTAENFSDPTAHQTPESSFIPKIVPENIRLKYPVVSEGIKSELLAEYFHEGIGKDQLLSALQGAMFFRDHAFIRLALESIVIDTNPDQIEIITICLDNLNEIGQDQHGCTDEEEVWRGICDTVVRVMKEANVVLSSSDPKCRSQLTEITLRSFSTIASLIRGKAFSDDISASNDTLIFPLCELVLNALTSFKDNPIMIERVGRCLISAAALSSIAVDRLYRGGAIALLLGSMVIHEQHTELELCCAEAFRSFSIENLINPCPMLSTAKKGDDEDTLHSLSDIGSSISASPSKKFPSTGKWDEVYKRVFAVIKRCCASISLPHIDENVATLIETCLHTLYRACETSVFDIDLIEKFLYSVDTDCIEVLCSILRVFPDSFRIQEGAIGLLAHILSTGNMEFNCTPNSTFSSFTDADRTKGSVDLSAGRSMTPPAKPLKPPKPSPATLTQSKPLNILVCPFEKRLESLLSCDPELKLLLKAMETYRIDDKKAIGIEETTNRRTKDSIQHGIFTAASLTRAGGFTSRTAAAKTGNFTMIGEDVPEFFKDFIEAFLTDENGDEISAASLQRNVAVILGIACKASKNIQRTLERSIYNELIFQAFDNFKNDVSVIIYGCRALCFTCRGNSTHQKHLLDMGVLNRLWAALNTGNNRGLWEVVDAVVLALIGLLEPPDEFEQEVVIPQDPVGLKSDSGTIKTPSTEEVNQRKVKYSAYKVAVILNKAKENSNSFVIKIGSLISEFLLNPECHSLIGNYLQFLSSIMFWIPNMLDEWSAAFIRLSECPKFVEQRLKKMQREQGLKFRQLLKNNKGVTGEEVVNELTKKGINATVELLSVNLKQFVQVALSSHKKQPHVLSAGLAIITAVFRRLCSDSITIGDELPYNTNQLLALHREDAVERGILDFCMEAKNSKSDDPILIRYSLWLLIIFVSQRKDKYSNLEIENQSLNSGNAIATKICFDGALEWIVLVLKKEQFKKLYSLQALGATFLIWMEHHGRFAVRDFDRLRDLKESLLHILAQDDSYFISMEQEGHDSYVRGQTKKLFGSLNIQVDKLIRLIDKHLRSVSNTTDAVVWDHVCRPIKLSISATVEEEDPKTLKVHPSYVLDIDWDDDLKWRVAYRFKIGGYIDLQEFLQRELDFLPKFVTITDLPSQSLLSKVFQKNNAAFLEGRRHQLQQLINDFFTVPAIFYCHKFVTFLEIPENVREFKIPAFLPRLNQDFNPLPVQSLVIDEANGLFFVGFGVLSKIGIFSSGNEVRGSLSIYKVSLVTESEACKGNWSASGHNLSRCCGESYNAGVCALSWEPYRRCVMVALATGPIIFYHLSSDLTTLTYSSELSYHNAVVGSITLDLSSNLMLTGALDSTVSVFSLKQGATVGQTTLGSLGITCTAFDRRCSIMFCGTNEGSVVLFDIAKTPPKKGHSIVLQNSKPENVGKGEVLSLYFDDISRFLYAAHYNAVHIYRVDISETPPSLWVMLQLNLDAKISSFEVFLRGQYVAAMTSNGSVAVFDLSDTAAASAGGKSNMASSGDGSDTAPCCNSAHSMTMSNFQKGGYTEGYICNGCGKSKKGTRWLCLRCPNGYDFCFTCKPSAALKPLCRINHSMEKLSSNPYRDTVYCNLCRFQGLDEDGAFYHCRQCKFDLCLSCSQFSHDDAHNGGEDDSTASHLLHWTVVVTMTTAVMRDWLRAKGCREARFALTRYDLLQLILNVASVSPMDLAKAVTPKAPSTKVLFAWRLFSAASSLPLRAADGSLAAYRPGTTFKGISFFQNMRALVFGASDGSLAFVSLADFIPPLTACELDDMAQLRAKVKSTHSGKTTVFDADTSGLKKVSTKGKRHILTKGL